MAPTPIKQSQPAPRGWEDYPTTKRQVKPSGTWGIAPEFSTEEQFTDYLRSMWGRHVSAFLMWADADGVKHSAEMEFTVGGDRYDFDEGNDGVTGRIETVHLKATRLVLREEL